MPKAIVQESRFDFRGGRVTAISPDLLNPNELVTTNVRLTSQYGAFGKRSGCQRIHANAFPIGIRGVTQWDITSGKQTVVISNGDLYFRNGLSFDANFIKAASSATARSTANQAGTAEGWVDPDGTDNGINTISVAASGGGSSATVAGDPGSPRLYCKLGDPAIDNNVDAADDRYTFSFKLTADALSLTPGVGSVAAAQVNFEYSTNDGGAWTPIGDTYSVGASPDFGPGVVTTEFTTTLVIPGAPAKLWIRLILKVTGYGAGTAVARVQCFNTAYLTDNYPVTWTTGTAKFSLTEPTIFAPFRAASAGAPLVLYMASGGHYFSWDGVSTLTQLDPTNSAPMATSLIPYHTRMFLMSASAATPGLEPKTIYWSEIGVATSFIPGDKTKGGKAVTDFLTGQQLTALEVIGSSLLMATIDSVMRFTGQSSDDIVISQNTEGISADVGAVGLLALKRFENVAAMLAYRGPYAVTETAAEPIGEQVLPDFDALDTANLSDSVVIYHKGRKELWFIVPGATDGGLNKTIFVQGVRLQAWYGPWTYSFGINCASNYTGSSGIENVIAGCSDGFVRLMDVGTLDDVLSNGTGGNNISLRCELPPLQFGIPGTAKTLDSMKLQASIPSGSNLVITATFDDQASDIGSFVDTTFDGTLRDYRVDFDGQGKRLKLVFTDNSSKSPQVNGFMFYASDMQRP